MSSRDCKLLIKTCGIAILLICSALPCRIHAGQRNLRTIEFTTSESSGSDIAVSPDGRTLVFSLVGQLFQMDSKGGLAEQLTDGRFHNSDPVFSPDGTRIAFISDRDGSDGNVFVFDLKERSLKQVTKEDSAARPAWSPDGERIAYLAFALEEWRPGEQPAIPARVRNVRVKDGQTRTVRSEARLYRSVFYQDNRLLWSVVLKMPGGSRWETRIEAEEERHLARLSGWMDRVLSFQDVFVGLGFDPVVTEYGSLYPMGSLWIARASTTTSLLPTWGSYAAPAIALSPGSKSAYLCAGGGLWRVSLRNGQSERLPFAAHVRMVLGPRTQARVMKWAHEPQALALLVRNLRTLDVTSGSFSEPHSVMIRNGRIAAVGPDLELELAEGTLVIDAAGRFGLPGFIDADVRLRYDPRSFLAYGVTTIREFGESTTAMKALEKRRESGEVLPRILFAGQVLEGSKQRWSGSTVPVSEEKAAASAVRQAVAEGASAVRFYATLRWSLQSAGAAEAHQLGVPVIGHAMSTDRVVKAALRGFDAVEHVGWGDRFYNDIAELLAQSGTAWAPTLAAMGGGALLLREAPSMLSDPRLLKWTPHARISEATQENMFKDTSTASLSEYIQSHLQFARELHDAGGAILLPTASPIQNTFHGLSLHWEMELAGRSGIAPIEILRAVTIHAATRMGAGDQLGAIEPGRLADIVILDRNPLQDIRDTRAIWNVIAAGKLLPNNHQ